MTTRKTTPKPPKPVPLLQQPLASREEMEDTVGLIVALRISEQKKSAQINARLHSVKTELMPQLQAIRDDLDNAFTQAREWAQAHPEEFTEARSIKMHHATVGFREGNPTLAKLSRRWTWERILEGVEAEPKMACYVRTTTELNKEALLEDRDKLGADLMKEYGLKVEQPDRFYVATDLEAPEARIAEVVS
jgi:phage host-nuclease inhibitor protein Gam